MQQAFKQITEKDGAIQADRPAGCPSGIQGSHWTGQVLDRRAKLRALFDVLGHSTARLPDGRTVQVTPDALKIIPPFHGAFSA